MSKQIWYRLLNPVESIDMLFSSYTELQRFWSCLPTSKALGCHWEVFEQ